MRVVVVPPGAPQTKPRALMYALAQARGELDAFKRAHGLRRAAVYPRSTLLQAGLLFCAAVFEARTWMTNLR